MDEADFLGDTKTIDAVERCFERIGEAARRMGRRFDKDYPALDLPALRKFGSVLRQDYDSVQPTFLWGFVANRLGPLEAMARVELEKLLTDQAETRVAAQRRYAPIKYVTRQ